MKRPSIGWILVVAVFACSTAISAAFRGPAFPSRRSRRTCWRISCPDHNDNAPRRHRHPAVSSTTTSLTAIHQDSDGKCVFGQKSYWDNMYDDDDNKSSGKTDDDTITPQPSTIANHRPSASYSWYCGYTELAPFWKELVPIHNKSSSSSPPRVLIAGMGNDPAPVAMFDDGYTNMVAFDYSAAGIQRAKALFGSERLMNQGEEDDNSRRESNDHGTGARLYVADATHLEHVVPDASVNATLDKGTLDAIYITGADILAGAVQELTRVTARGGIVLSISRVIPPDELLGVFAQVQDPAESSEQQEQFDNDNESSSNDSRAGYYWENIHNGELAFAPDGEATIDLGAELYSWRRTDKVYCRQKDDGS